MRVLRNERPEKVVTLKELYVGSVYMYADKVFMKIADEATKNAENSDATEVQVVDVETGYYQSVKDSIKVKPIRATLKV